MAIVCHMAMRQQNNVLLVEHRGLMSLYLSLDENIPAISESIMK